VDNEPALGGETARVEVEIAKLSPVALVTILDFAAVDLPDIR
jgi:hypothetical protein